MSAHRLKRVKEEIRQVVSSLLLFDLDDPDLKGLAITRVVVTKDLGIARVYFEGGQSPEQQKRILQALARAKGFIRNQLASHLDSRKVPDLTFFYDETLTHVRRVEQLLKGI